jgi:hypothetical protein
MRKREQIAFCVVMACIGLLLTAIIVFYATKSSNLPKKCQNNTLTLNVEKSGWTIGYDNQGYIVYKQKQFECRVQ